MGFMPTLEFCAETRHAFHEIAEYGGKNPTDIHSIAVVDGSLITCGKDMKVQIRDLATGEILNILEGHTYDVNAVTCLDGAIYSGADARGFDREYLKAWELKTGAA